MIRDHARAFRFLRHPGPDRRAGATLRVSASQNGYSDIFAAPLDGGEARKIACQVYALDQMQADESALYYRSWVGDVIGRISK
jgi:hypothetical protein